MTTHSAHDTARRLGVAGGTNLTDTRRDPHAGHFSRSPSVASANSRPRVHNSVAKSRRALKVHSRMDFIASRLPHAQRTRTCHPWSCTSPRVSAMFVTLTFDYAPNKQGTNGQVKASAATVDDFEDRVGRRTRAFWHRFPKDDAWRECTLAYAEIQCFKLEPSCRNCFHRARVMTGAEVAAWTGASMDTPIIALAARLVCSRCHHAAGYFHLHNPQVNPRT